MKNLNFIIRVEKTDYRNLAGAKILNNKEISIPDSIEWVNVPLASKPAQLQISDKVENKADIYTHKCVFKTAEEWNTRKHYAYRLTTVDGAKLLIGNSNRPFVISSLSENHPSSMTESTMTEVTLSYIVPFKAYYIR